MLSTLAPVVMNSATTSDSKSVTIDYTLSSPVQQTQPLTFGVYRSNDARFSADDTEVGRITITPEGKTSPTLDDKGVHASLVGGHQLTIPLPNGLPIDPKRPYVLVVANPSDETAAQTSPTASFRKFTIGVLTHGGIEDPSWKNGPPWELVMAKSLREQGYDAVIPFNWVSKSSTPGEAAKQGPRLVADVLKLAEQAPPNEPIDIHFIGHSEGGVVNTVAINQLEKQATPAIRQGFLEDTLLDPHAANNGFPGKQFSVSGVLGGTARAIIRWYQGKAKDPMISVPSGVDQAEVFYQHSPATNSEIYNLWGQVPVRGSASYFNLTASGVKHSGKKGVAAWYQNNIVPSLGDGAPELRAQALSGHVAPADLAAASPKQVAQVHQPRFEGTAGPGAVVKLYAGPADKPTVLAPLGKTVVDSQGDWSISSRPLSDGNYRVIAVSTPPPTRSVPRFIMNPTAPLGELVVDTKTTTARSAKYFTGAAAHQPLKPGP